MRRGPGGRIALAGRRTAVLGRKRLGMRLRTESPAMRQDRPGPGPAAQSGAARFWTSRPRSPSDAVPDSLTGPMARLTLRWPGSADAGPLDGLSDVGRGARVDVVARAAARRTAPASGWPGLAGSPAPALRPCCPQRLAREQPPPEGRVRKTEAVLTKASLYLLPSISPYLFAPARETSVVT